VIKGVLTDVGFLNAVQAQQVYGGHGYIAEWGMEQFVRDSRIAMIYEGANGIQALDLVGRKLPRNAGRALMAFFKELDSFIAENKDDEQLAVYISALQSARDDLEKATGWLMNNAMAKPDHAGAGATDYMHLMGIVVLTWMWAQIAKAASAELANGGGDKDFLNAKLVTARYFAERVVPETSAHLKRLSAGADTLMELPAEAF
jgi:hypothetical protein